MLIPNIKMISNFFVSNIIERQLLTSNVLVLDRVTYKQT